MAVCDFLFSLLFASFLFPTFGLITFLFSWSSSPPHCPSSSSVEPQGRGSDCKRIPKVSGSTAAFLFCLFLFYFLYFSLLFFILSGCQDLKNLNLNHDDVTHVTYFYLIKINNMDFFSPFPLPFSPLLCRSFPFPLIHPFLCSSSSYASPPYLLPPSSPQARWTCRCLRRSGCAPSPTT